MVFSSSFIFIYILLLFFSRCVRVHVQVFELFLERKLKSTKDFSLQINILFLFNFFFYFLYFSYGVVCSCLKYFSFLGFIRWKLAQHCFALRHVATHFFFFYWKSIVGQFKMSERVLFGHKRKIVKQTFSFIEISKTLR